MNERLSEVRLRTLEFANGAKQDPIFSTQEIKRRQDGLRDVMSQANVDWLVLTSIHNIAYYTGFIYTAFGRPYGLVVGPQRMHTISANIDGGQPYRRSWCDNLVYTDWHRDSFEATVASLAPRGASIGVEADHLTLQMRDRLSHALGVDSSFVDVAPLLMRQRMIKSDEEIALIKSGARIADVGGFACRDAIAEGVCEYEVAQAGVDAMNRAIADTYPTVELRDTWVWFQSGLNTDGAHNPLTSRKLVRGDILSLNTFPMIAGYYTALERTMFLEAVDDASKQAWLVNLEAYHTGLAWIRPGVRCAEICEKVNAVYRRHGLLERRTFGYGHSFGVLSHYYGREAGLELREDVDTILEPNMVISMEPMITLPEGVPGAGGYREHDILVITQTGAENITGFPVGPEHNIIG
jgi:creatinase